MKSKVETDTQVLLIVQQEVQAHQMRFHARMPINFEIERVIDHQSCWLCQDKEGEGEREREGEGEGEGGKEKGGVSNVRDRRQTTETEESDE
jgi:hypothetical protein